MVYRIGGYILSNCRKNCRYIFGDFFISAKLNEKERVFEINLHKDLPVRQEDGTVVREPITDYVDMDKFKKFWGAQWRITYTKTEQA